MNQEMDFGQHYFSPSIVFSRFHSIPATEWIAARECVSGAIFAAVSSSTPDSPDSVDCLPTHLSSFPLHGVAKPHLGCANNIMDIPLYSWLYSWLSLICCIIQN